MSAAGALSMASSASSTPRIFFSVSSYSLVGSLSATMPAPAWTVTRSAASAICSGTPPPYRPSSSSTVAVRMMIHSSASPVQVK